MKKLLLLLLPLWSFAQTYHAFIHFSDKDEQASDYDDYFHPKALERREKAAIPLDNFSDLPVSTGYINQVAAVATETGYTSRWFNGIWVKATAQELTNIGKLSFVTGITRSRMKNMQPAIYESDLELGSRYEQEILDQTGHLQQSVFASQKLDGSGIRIAVLDGGFPDVDTHEAFAHLRQKNRIKGTYDFTKKDTDVYRGVSHGTSVLSNITGIWDENPMGLATGAEFLLAITEIRTEPFREEEYWLAAVEWADKEGADIINSSLGYTYHRYFPEEMDGSSFVSKAAAMAAKKGILVINSAGNEGSSENWRIIGAPADADSILSIGAINPATGLRTNFSSFGPTADKRLKPNITAYGINVVASKNNNLSKSSGTSFSAPLISGFAACAWQSDPKLTNIDLLKKLEMSGHLYPYFDYGHGYGIPSAEKFLYNEPKTETFTLSEDQEALYITPTTSIHNPTYLYYHFENDKGYLEQYLVDRLSTSGVFKISKKSMPANTAIIRIHLLGYTKIIELK